MISIEKLKLRISGQEILHQIDLHLQPGDIYGLLGPNGSGKSSTIFALLGLHRYTGGQIRVLNLDPAQYATDIRRNVGTVPEQAGFYGWMTASNYLLWYSRLYEQAQAIDEIHQLLERVGIDSGRHSPIATYSRGMKQRLALARALVGRPKLLILDEPTNGLDPKGRREIHDLLLDFTADGKTGVLLSTHLLDDVDRLCNRIGIINQGRTRFEGDLHELIGGKGSGFRYRLRMKSPVGRSPLPAGLTLLGNEGDWWHVQLQSGVSNDPSMLWEKLWNNGWRIQEIRSELSNLEHLYLNITKPDVEYQQEVTQ